MPCEGLQDTRLVCKAAGPYPMGTLRGAWCVNSGPGCDARGVLSIRSGVALQIDCMTAARQWIALCIRVEWMVWVS
jgi:hypothetical protein